MILGDFLHHGPVFSCAIKPKLRFAKITFLAAEQPLLFPNVLFLLQMRNFYGLIVMASSGKFLREMADFYGRGCFVAFCDKSQVKDFFLKNNHIFFVCLFFLFYSSHKFIEILVTEVGFPVSSMLSFTLAFSLFLAR